MLESFILAGVPVLSLPMGNLRPYSFFDSGIDVSSPTRPPDIFSPPLNITPFKCVMTYMDKDVPGDIKDFQCSCGHFNQKAQHYITQFLTQGYNERTNN